MVAVGKPEGTRPVLQHPLPFGRPAVSPAQATGSWWGSPSTHPHPDPDQPQFKDWQKTQVEESNQTRDLGWNSQGSFSPQELLRP